MSKEFTNPDDFIKEYFPSMKIDKNDNEKTSLQDYIELVSIEFSKQIEKIIAD
jgi:hypothetical protein